MLFKLINNILYLTTVHNLSFNELLYKKITPSIYSMHPYTHKLILLGCTVHFNWFVLYQYCVHTHHTFSNNTNNTRHSSFNLVALRNTHHNFHTTFTLVYTHLFTHTLLLLSYCVLMSSSSIIHNG